MHLFPPKTTAHAQALHSDLMVRPAQHMCKNSLGLGRVLGAALDKDLAALIHRGKRCLGLQVKVFLPGKLGNTRNHLRGTSQCCIRVSTAHCSGHPLEGLPLDRLSNGYQGRQWFVVNHHGAGPCSGRILVFREHPGNCVAVVHDFGGEQWLITFDAAVIDAWNIHSGKNTDHTGNR